VLPEVRTGAEAVLLWATLNHVWEYCAGLGSRRYDLAGCHPFAALEAQHGPLGRVVLHVRDTLSIEQWLRHFPQIAAGIRVLAGQGGLDTLLRCPWRLRYEPLPASQWLAVEQWGRAACAWVPRQG